MSRILKTLLLVALVVVWCTATWAAATPKYRMYQGNIRVDAPDFVAPPSTGRSFGYPIRVGATADIGIQVGVTYYDYQHNGSTGRQVDKSGNNIQVVFMKAPEAATSPRFVNWNRVPVTGPPATDPDGVRRVPLGAAITVNGQAFSAIRPGYCNLRLRPSGPGVATFHDAPEGDQVGPNYTLARLELAAGSGIWGETPTSFAPNPPGPEYSQDGITWPKAAIGTCGGDEYHHAVGTWGGAANQTWYWRGLITAGPQIIWDENQPTMLDSVDAFITSVVETYGEEVTVAMIKQINTTNADLVRYKSTDCGQTWLPRENLSNFGADPDGEGGHVEVDAVYDAAGDIHIIFNTIPASGQEWPCNLYHWSDLGGLRLITSAGWINTCENGTNDDPGTGNGAGTNNLAIAEPNISYRPAGLAGGSTGSNELLFAVWTQYGPTDNDCATLDDQGTLGGFVNGEIYYSCSSNDGSTWDRPQNITKTVTADCIPGECDSESWVTSAAMADSAVYISYVEDKHAGAIVFGGGMWTENPYKVMAPEARQPVPEPVIAVSPTSYIELNADTLGTQSSVILNIISVGNQDLTYTVTVENDNGGASFVQVEGGGFYTNTITAGSAPDQLVVTFDCTDLANPSEHNWRLSVLSNDVQNNDPGEEIYVNLQVFAANEWYTCVEDSLSTSQHVMQVSACLEMGDAGTVGTGFYRFSDQTEWMFSGSAVVTLVNDSGETVAFHNAFMSPSDRTRTANRSFRAQSPMTVVRSEEQNVGDSTFNADRAYGQASSTDTTIGIDYEVVFPQKSDMYHGYYYKFEMVSLTGAPITGVHYGVAADIDLDDATLGGTASENEGAGDEDEGWIGGRAGTNDSLGNFLPFNDWMALFYIPPDSTPCIKNGGRAGQVLGNPDYVHPDNAFDPDSLYALFDRFGAPGSWGTDIYEDTLVTNDDISVMMVNAWNQTIDNVAITKWGFGVAASNVSIPDLEATIAALRTGANVECQVDCAIQVAGDVNETGNITAADIIYLVGFVFKGGPPPLPCAANGDVDCKGTVTAADIIYLVNHVFKGGPAPCDICNEPAAMECVL